MGTQVTGKKSLLEIESIMAKLKATILFFNGRKGSGLIFPDHWERYCFFHLMSDEKQLHALIGRRNPVCRQDVFLEPIMDHEIEYIGRGPSPAGQGEYARIPYGSAAILKANHRDPLFVFNISDDDILATGSGLDLPKEVNPYTLIDHLVVLFARVDDSYAACTPWKYGYESKYKPFNECALSGIPKLLRSMLRIGRAYVKSSHGYNFVIFDSQEFENIFVAACALPQKERMAIWNTAVGLYNSTRPEPRILTGDVPRDVFEHLVRMCGKNRALAQYIIRRSWFWSLHIMEWAQKIVNASPSTSALLAILSGLIYEYDHGKDKGKIQTILAAYNLPPCPDIVGMEMGASLRSARAAIRAGIVA